MNLRFTGELATDQVDRPILGQEGLGQAERIDEGRTVEFVPRRNFGNLLERQASLRLERLKLPLRIGVPRA